MIARKEQTGQHVVVPSYAELEAGYVELCRVMPSYAELEAAGSSWKRLPAFVLSAPSCARPAGSRFQRCHSLQPLEAAGGHDCVLVRAACAGSRFQRR